MSDALEEVPYLAVQPMKNMYVQVPPSVEGPAQGEGAFEKDFSSSSADVRMPTTQLLNRSTRQAYAPHVWSASLARYKY